MLKIVLTFGLISGGILLAMIAFIGLTMQDIIDFEQSEIYGWTTMLLAFLMVFFGIRSYRENVNGGTITFGRAFKVGILITLVTCAVFVIAWEIAYFGFIPDFDERFSAHAIQKLRDEGASAEKIAAEEMKMAKFRELYKNPLINIGITFLEIFPVGLIVTLISAAMLRKGPSATPTAATA